MLRHLAPLTRSVHRALPSNAATKASYRFFADVVPGVGKGKTSTGLVSRNKETYLNNCHRIVQ